jgi:hypothetical protein
MTVKMQMIQFGSILSLFRMRVQTLKSEQQNESPPESELIEESRPDAPILHQSHNEQTVTLYLASQ